MTKIKTYALSYGDDVWIENNEIVMSVEEADIVIMPGGSDVNPIYYGHEPIQNSFVNRHVDKYEYEILQKAIELNKFVIGICKGAQMATAIAGGYLIQDVNGHHNDHEITTVDRKVLMVTSCHHQMCVPYELPKENYEVLAWSKEISKKYIIQGEMVYKPPIHAIDEDENFMEPEVIWYPKIKALAVQGHPEWMNQKDEFIKWLNETVRIYMEVK